MVSLPSERSARSQTSPGRVSERCTLPLLGLGRGCSRRTQKAFGTAMRLCATLFRGVAAPLGCVIFFRFCRNCGLYTLFQIFFSILQKYSVRRFQNGLHLCPHSGVGNIPTFPQRIAHNVSHVEGGSFSSEATVASDLPSDFYKYVNCINNSACRFCCNCFCCMVR